jgi:hypothetical protein
MPYSCCLIYNEVVSEYDRFQTRQVSVLDLHKFLYNLLEQGVEMRTANVMLTT